MAERKAHMPSRTNRGFTGDPVPASPESIPPARANRGLAGDAVEGNVLEAQLVEADEVVLQNPHQVESKHIELLP